MGPVTFVPATWKLPESLRNRLGTGVGRQRLMQADGHLLLVLHDVPVAGETTRRGIWVWRDADGNWKGSLRDPGLATLEELMQRYTQRLEEFDRLEDAARHADDYSQLLEGLAPVVRSARNLLEVLEEARKAMPDERRLIDPRDRAYEISRWSELLFDDAKNSMDVAVVRRAEEQAQASNRMSVTAHRLNVLAALFFPLATLGEVFGTTLTENWSWSQTATPFLLFLWGGALSGLILAMFISRQPK
jgi:hypothetical protein